MVSYIFSSYSQQRHIGVFPNIFLLLMLLAHSTIAVKDPRKEKEERLRRFFALFLGLSARISK